MNSNRCYNLLLLELFLLLQSPLFCDESVKAANLSKESIHQRTKTAFYPTTRPLTKSSFRVREKLQAAVKQNSKNYYDHSKQTCFRNQQVEKPSLKDFNDENDFGDEPPPAGNIKVADAVTLLNKDSAVAGDDILVEEEIEAIKDSLDENDLTAKVQVTTEMPHETIVEEKDTEELEVPLQEEERENEDTEVPEDNVIDEDDATKTKPSLESSEEKEEEPVDSAETTEQQKGVQNTEKPSIENEVVHPTEQPTISEATTTPAPNIETTTKPDEKPVKIVDDDLQSFEEWKKNQIQSKEESTFPDTLPTHQRTIRTKKTQMNYASQDCGAKVLSHNPEAKNVGAILDENKDLYMLNPCKEQIWFVVELCEPIQIEQVQLGNLELFSSMPHQFELHVSERYPAREWRHLGIFEARNERVVQTYTSKNENDMFAKYLKFEMKSHFGNEHFCPLTLIRVLGVSMVEEYENHEDQKSLKEEKKSENEDKTAEATEKAADTDADSSDDDSDTIGNVFNNIVKNVVGKVGNLLNGNSGSPNATVSENVTSDLPPNTTQDDVIDPEWESPVTLVTNKSEVEEATKKRPIITLIETGDGREIITVEFFEPPLYPLKFLNHFSPKKFGTNLCWFLEFMYRVSILSCVVPNGNRTSVSGAFPFLVEKEFVETPTKKTDVNIPENPHTQPNFVLVEKKVKTEIETEKSETKSEDDLPSLDAESVFVKDTPNSTQTDKPKAPQTEPVKPKLDFASEKDLNASRTSSQTQVDATINETLLNEFQKTFSGGKQNPVCDDKEKSSGEIENPEKASKSPPQNDNILKPQSEKQLEVKTAEETGDKDTTYETKEPEMKTEKPADEKPANTAQKDTLHAEKEVVTGASFSEETPSQSKTDEIVTESKDATTSIPSVQEQNESKPEDTVVINPGTNQKESVLMRLSNRIRTLEQNLSLSSAYLENLSQRYKRKMDEMQRAFNQTQKRLKEMTETAEEKDIKHTQALNSQKEEINELRTKFKVLEASTEQLNRDMIARHFCLMALESLILIVIAVTCFGARQGRMLRRVEAQTEEIVNRALLHKTKSMNMNGCAKNMSYCNHKKHLTPKDHNSIGDRILSGSSSAKSVSCSKSLPTDRPSSWPLTPSLSNTSVQRRKSINKINGSPIKKRKTGQNGFLKKTNCDQKPASGFQNRAASGNGSWTTDLPKTQKHGKIKKQAWKHDTKNGRISPENLSNIKSMVSTNRPRSASLSESSCCKEASLWQRCTSFSSALVGKAR